VIAVLDQVIGERPLAEWAERFDHHGVWWAPAQPPSAVVEDPQLAANDGFVRLGGGPDDGGQRTVNGPVSFSGVAAPRGRTAPRLGEHTDEVLKELE
jgi:crotonobetainyl-CoA:carnitine CoA-transferase CaiB-like acyl-CoA transferase